MSISGGTLKDVTPTLKALAAAIEACNESIVEVFNRLNAVHQAFAAALNATRATVDHRPSIGAVLSPMPHLLDNLGKTIHRVTQPSSAAQGGSLPATLPTFLLVVQKDCVDTLATVISHIKASTKSLNEAQVAADDAASRRSAVESKVGAYQRKGKPLADSQTLQQLQANAVEAERAKTATMSQWLQDEQTAMLSLSTGLVHTFRCFSEHVSGISGVLHDAMDRVFQACPSPPSAQAGLRATSRSRSPPGATALHPEPLQQAPYRNLSTAATAGGSMIYTPLSPARAVDSSPDRVILSPQMPHEGFDDRLGVPAYYRPRQRVSDTVSRRPSEQLPRYSAPSSRYAAPSTDLYP